MTAAHEPEDESDAEQRHLGQRLRRIHMPTLVRELSRPCSSALLVLDGHDLAEVSTYGAVGIRAGMEAHLARDPDNRVRLVEPDRSDCFQHLADLMGPSSGQAWSWAGTRSAAARGSDVLVPATVIRDQEDAQLIAQLAIPTAASAHAYDMRVRHLLQEAGMVFLDNVEQHARSHSVPPVIAAAYHPGSNELQLVCVNLEEDDALPIGDSDALHAAIMNPEVGVGGINGLVALPHGGLNFAVRMMAGSGRGTRFSNRSSDWRQGGGSFPGFVAGLEVQVSR